MPEQLILRFIQVRVYWLIKTWLISLKKNNFKINSVYDLSGKSVVSFQNATEFLPAPFKALTTKLPRSYEEVVYQAAQVDQLMKEWVDVVVLEKRVFLYYLQQYKATVSNSNLSQFTQYFLKHLVRLILPVKCYKRFLIWGWPISLKMANTVKLWSLMVVNILSLLPQTQSIGQLFAE